VLRRMCLLCVSGADIGHSHRLHSWSGANAGPLLRQAACEVTGCNCRTLRRAACLDVTQSHVCDVQSLKHATGLLTLPTAGGTGMPRRA